MKILAAAKKHLLCLLGAILLTAASGCISVWLASEYYNRGAYHYDSVYYRQLAAEAYQGYLQEGAIRQFLAILYHNNDIQSPPPTPSFFPLVNPLKGQDLKDIKDTLDITLGLFIYPPALNHFYGHLLGLLTFLFLFYYQLLLYVSRRTGSFLLAITGGASVLIFRWVYDAFWGMADYWKYNSVAILAGCSVLAFLLSQKLSKKSWTFLSGLCIGLAAMQHFASSFYIAFILAPLILYALVQPLRQKQWVSATARLISFLVPALAIIGFIVAFNWQAIYEYYFVRAYCYSSRWAIAEFLLRGLYPCISNIDIAFRTYPYGSGLLAPIAIIILALALLPFIRYWREQREDILIGLWLIIGMPLVILLVRGYYFGFYQFWAIFAAIFFSTILPRNPRYRTAKSLGRPLLLVIMLLAALQFHLTRRINNDLAKSHQIDREFYLRLATYIANDPAAQIYGLFFDEASSTLFNYLQYDVRLPIEQPINNIKFHTLIVAALANPRAQDNPTNKIAHDEMLKVAIWSGNLAKDYYQRRGNIFEATVAIRFYDYYFRLICPNAPAPEVVRRLLAKLSHWPGALAVGYYDLNHIYQPQSDPLASAVVMGISRTLQNDPHWFAAAKWPSPCGQLILYRYSPVPLPRLVRWCLIAPKTAR